MESTPPEVVGTVLGTEPLECLLGASGCPPGKAE